MDKDQISVHNSRAVVSKVGTSILGNSPFLAETQLNFIRTPFTRGTLPMKNSRSTFANQIIFIAQYKAKGK